MSNIEDAKKFIYSRNGNYFGTFMVDDTEFIRYTCEKGHQNSATLYVCYFRDWCQQCSIDRNKSAKQKIKGLLKMKEKRRETISYQLYKVHTPITPKHNSCKNVAGKLVSIGFHVSIVKCKSTLNNPKFLRETSLCFVFSHFGRVTKNRYKI